MKNTCPICGYPELERDPQGDASFEICPSCYFHFRVDDDDKGYTYNQWRNEWVQAGMPWKSNPIKKPKDWDAKKQLKNIGVDIP